MKTLYAVLALLLLPAAVVSAQTDVSPYVYATVATGQMTRFDYVASAGDVWLVNLLTAIFLSLWAMFLLVVFIIVKFRGQA